MDKDVGKDVNQFRTSLDYRPQHNETKLIQKFEDRAAFLTRIPRSHQEALQILEYGSGPLQLGFAIDDLKEPDL